MNSSAITTMLGVINRRLGTTSYLVEGPGFTITIGRNGPSTKFETIALAVAYLHGWLDAFETLDRLNPEEP